MILKYYFFLSQAKPCFCDESTTAGKLDAILGALKRIEDNHLSQKKLGKVDVVLGAQWGDEGKGKLVDILSGQYDICARVAGGSNAGHTIVANVRRSLIL